MFPMPFVADPEWYQRAWYTERPQPRRRTLNSLARFGVVIAILLGGGLAVANHVPQNLGGGWQHWVQTEPR